MADPRTNRPEPGADRAPVQQPAVPPPADAGYTDEEEAEVRKRLEDLGYVE
jgi:hypothetical protein